MASLLIALIIVAPLVLLVADLVGPFGRRRRSRSRGTVAPFAAPVGATARPAPQPAAPAVVAPVTPSTTVALGNRVPEVAPQAVARRPVVTRPVAAAANATFSPPPAPARRRPAAEVTASVAQAPALPASFVAPAEADPVEETFSETPYAGETPKDAAARRRRRGLAERRAARRASRRDYFGDGMLAGTVADRPHG